MTKQKSDRRPCCGNLIKILTSKRNCTDITIPNTSWIVRTISWSSKSFSCGQKHKNIDILTSYSYIWNMSDIQEAEMRMNSIEKRLISIEALKTHGSSSEVSDALAQYQQQVLAKLKVIRGKITEEGGDVSLIKKERDDLAIENTLLKKEMEKQNYRIQHLIKALNSAEQCS